ncbi:MAG: aryl-sulfate sulfotransferase, partial [Planctomycetota bacterium]
MYNFLFLIITLIFAWLILSIKHIRKITTAAYFLLYVIFIVLVPFIISTRKQTSSRYSSAITGGQQSSSQEVLASLPYFDWAPAENPEKVSVTKYDPEFSFKGINIFTSMTKAQAYLIDMNGKPLHTWYDSNKDNKWNEHVRVCPNGDLLVILKDEMLMRLDWDSNIKWINKLRCHHQITLDENGDIYLLARKDKMIFIAGFPVPIVNDYIVVLSSDGKTKSQIPLLKAVKKYIPYKAVPEIYWSIIEPRTLTYLLLRKNIFGYFCQHDTIFDIFHNNTLKIIDRDIEGVCKKGNLLICMRELDLVGILDIEKQELVWNWGPGQLSRPHHPTLLKNGNILIFDN